MPTLQVIIDGSKAKTGAQEVSDATGKIVDGAKKVDESFRGMQGTIDTVSTRVRRAAGAFTVLAGGVSSVIALRQGLLTLAEFSRQMAALEGVTKASAEQLQNFETVARSLGANTIFTASQAAEGMLFLARAGFNANEVVAAIGPTLQLATAAVIDLASASDLVANTINQFSLSAGDATRVADVFVEVSNRTNTNVLQLGEAFEYVGPAAAVAGKSIEETSAVLGVLADRGIKASIAGTNLRGIIAQLAGPLDRQTKALETLGVSLADVDPTLNSIADIFDTLRGAGLDASLAVELFGRRNFNAAVVLANSTEEIRKNEQALIDAAGAAQFNADKIDDSLFGAFRRLKSAAQEATLAVGDRGAESALSNLSDLAADVVKNLFNVQTGAEDASFGVGLLSSAIRLAVGLATSYITVNIGASVLSHALAFRQAAIAAGSYGTALSALISTQGVLTLGLGAVAFGIYEIVDSMQQAKADAKAFQQEIEALKEASVGLASEASQVAGTLDRLATAQSGFSPRDLSQQFNVLEQQLVSLRETIVTATDFDPVNIPLGIDRSSLDGTYNQATVAVESLREIFGKAGKEMLEEYLAGFAGSDADSAINSPIGPAIEARQARLAELLSGGLFSRQVTNFDQIQGLKNQLSTLREEGERLLQLDELTLSRRGLLDLIGADSTARNIPAEDALRLIDQLLQGIDQQAATALESVNELYAAEQSAAVEEVFAQFRSGLDDERNKLTLSSAEYEVYITRKKALAAAEKEGIIVRDDQIQTLEDEVRALEELRTTVEATEAARKESEKAEKDAETARQNSLNSIQSYLQSVREQNALMQVEGRERAILAATFRVLREEQNLTEEETLQYLQAAKLLAIANAELTAEADRQADAERDRLQAVRDAEREEERRARNIQRATEAMQEQNRALAFEYSLLGQSTEAKKAAREAAEFYSNALLAYNGNAETATMLTNDFKNRLLDLEDATRISQLYDDIGVAFSDSFSEIIRGAKSVEDALEGMVRNIYDLLFQELVARQIASFMSGLLGNLFGFGGLGAGYGPGGQGPPNPFVNQAMGGAWMNGVQMFADGGVINRPTMFPTSGGLGMMSEFGQAEAIMPLTRTATGELGVRGGGGGSVINNYFNITTPNADSFRASKAQIGRELSRSMSRS